MQHHLAGIQPSNIVQLSNIEPHVAEYIEYPVSTHRFCLEWSAADIHKYVMSYRGEKGRSVLLSADTLAQPFNLKHTHTVKRVSYPVRASV